MPIVNFLLPEGLGNAEQARRLLVDASRLYSEVLDSPLARIRAGISRYSPETYAVGGQCCDQGGAPAPFFEFFVLAGRPPEQRRRLAEGFTALLVENLGVRREWVRGHCRQVAPEDWSIGGVPADVQRAAELAARAGEGSA